MNTLPIRPLLSLKLVILAALAFLLLLGTGCHWVGITGNGHVTSETRPLGNITQLETDGAFSINWTEGAPSLRITTDSNLFEYLRTETSGEKLRLKWIKPLRATRKIVVDISSPVLRRVTLNGASRLVATNLNGPEFYLEANGASRVVLNGKVNAMSGEMNGASRLEADELITRAMELEINGAGRAEVNVTEVLKAAINGAGRVTYSGDPVVSKEISGAGSIRKKD